MTRNNGVANGQWVLAESWVLGLRGSAIQQIWSTAHVHRDRFNLVIW